MATIVADIPARFWQVTYDQAHDPNSPVLNPMAQGANCQNFAYELLRHFGRHVPYLRSSNLWEDTEHTTIAAEPRALDLARFREQAEYAVFIGAKRVKNPGHITRG